MSEFEYELFNKLYRSNINCNPVSYAVVSDTNVLISNNGILIIILITIVMTLLVVNSDSFLPTLVSYGTALFNSSAIGFSFSYY